jgi:hypothetical protein
MNLRNFTPPKGTLAPQRELTLNERKAAGRANFAEYAAWQIVRHARMSATDSVKVKVREYGCVALVEFKNDTLHVTCEGRTNGYPIIGTGEGSATAAKWLVNRNPCTVARILKLLKKQVHDAKSVKLMEL